MTKTQFLDQLAHYNTPKEIRITTTFTNRQIKISLKYKEAIKTIQYSFDNKSYFSVYDILNKQIESLKDSLKDEKVFSELEEGQWCKTTKSDKYIYLKMRLLGCGDVNCLRFYPNYKSCGRGYINPNTKVKVCYPLDK